MRALIQRVRKASVSVQMESLGSIETGLVIFLGIGAGDTLDDARYLVDKALNLRIFPDEADRLDRSAREQGAGLLVVSQFTLYAETRKGRRPSFTDAAPPIEAVLLFNQTANLFRESGLEVVTGQFAKHMVVELQNDGPVTIWLDSTDRLRPRKH